LAMLLTIALTWIVARAVIRPLRKLTESAREMSQKQLPQLVESMRAGGEIDAVVLPPIEIKSADEIGELARAFNDIEAVTVQVARDQALLLRKGMGDLFVNLARRNQSLLERQLELLDELERNEHDPAALDALFKLDHMATRMRRNAESLLVLSGAEQPRQWQQPIGLLDVVRSASAEIADFPRVELVGVDDELAVSGRAVADLAHLLAELLENATSFSPPDAAVVVSGGNTAVGFALAVSDQGIGMPPEKIAEANQLLAKPPIVGLALSRALGLHVVASLAARHGIRVELRPGAPVGLVALVSLPANILEREATPEATPPVFAPHHAPDGHPTTLGARPVAWRPPDEPPVEEWRAEGLVEREPPTPPPTQPTSQPTQLPKRPASPRPTLPVVDIPQSPGRMRAEAAAAAARAQHPAVPQADVPPVHDVAQAEVPADEVPHAEAPPMEAPAPEAQPVDEPPLDEPFDDAPLTVRVPGRHLSHRPTLVGDDEVSVTDPFRPYRVHELLTRHAQGKRRGRAERDDDSRQPPPASPEQQWTDRHPEDER
jgi:signal transduction histidine kinase